MGMITRQDLECKMNNKTTNTLNHNKKRPVRHIKNPFLKLMNWIGNARKSDMVCKG